MSEIENEIIGIDVDSREFSNIVNEILKINKSIISYNSYNDKDGVIRADRILVQTIEDGSSDIDFIYGVKPILDSSVKQERNKYPPINTDKMMRVGGEIYQDYPFGPLYCVDKYTRNNRVQKFYRNRLLLSKKITTLPFNIYLETRKIVKRINKPFIYMVNNNDLNKISYVHFNNNGDSIYGGGYVININDNLNLIKPFIKKNFEILLKHWNNKISNNDVISLLGGSK